ncbi:MAG TPA: hypothetical protein VFJ58_22580 [Armatimonadota bacterium]|nr:hypothetical protein [Armatimonadota bacterium]
MMRWLARRSRAAQPELPILLAAMLLTSCAVHAQSAGQAANGTWAFAPAPDTFSPGALLDLRSMNERVAGESGFVKRTPDGNDFELGNGKPVRFWAVDEYVQRVPGMEVIAHKARWLAKRGVNMVRVHAALQPTAPGSKITDVNQKEVDQIWKLVAAMKKEGIYTTISPYWAVPVKIQDSWGVPGGSGQSAMALVFWDKTMQTGYKAWLKALYTPVNPYTGVPLAKDPAVAIIQLQNEDSPLFWTMQNVKGPQLDEVETLYGGWLAKKYGSLEKANTTWGGEHPAASAFQANQGDDFANGRAAIYIVWQWTQPQKGYMAKRLADQLEFFAQMMYNFNREMADYIHRDLGCGSLINDGNWRPADPIKLFDAERYSYTAGDVMGVNRYFTGVHDGPDNGWAIRPGDHFTNNSALLDPTAIPTNIKQPVGYPFIIPETEWVAPTAYQSEGSFLIAAYESLTGVDTSYFFADGDTSEWQPAFAKPVGNWQPPLGKWSIATPEQLGQFPAAALMYRMSYIERGKTAVHEERSLNDLWQRRSPLIAEEGGFDPNRDAADLPPNSAVKTGVNPLAFLVGPVEVKLGGDPALSRVIDLAPYIDTANEVVKSDTGQIQLNYGIGVCRLNAPKAQGATGFLKKAGPIALGDITIRSGNDYGTILVVSMDGLPIGSSHKILVQVGTIARPTGWEDKDADWTSKDGKQTFHGKEVVATGQNPWQINDTDFGLSVKNSGLKSATLLDMNGMPAGSVPVTRAGANLTVRLPTNAMYVVLQ